jgi:predicted Zn-ribbon and HTH transcriptional regulator
MDELKKKNDEQARQIAKLLSDNASLEQSGHSQPYKCNVCGNRVSYTFIMQCIKKTGMCPSCYHNDGEEDPQVKELQDQIKELKNEKA